MEAHVTQTVKPLVKQGLTELIHSYFHKEDWSIAEAVCMAESGCQSKRSDQPNTDGSYDWGIFQVNDIHRAKVNGNLQALLDPETNIRVAAQIRYTSGWGAWTTFRTGKYLQYLK